MGASTSYRQYKDSLGTATIKEMWNNAVDNSLYEYGHSYSGDIGMLGPKIAKWFDQDQSIDRAYEYIDTVHQKWNPAIACSYRDENNEKWWLIGGWCAS